jgi:hypothetical protein
MSSSDSEENGLHTAYKNDTLYLEQAINTKFLFWRRGRCHMEIYVPSSRLSEEQRIFRFHAERSVEVSSSAFGN